MTYTELLYPTGEVQQSMFPGENLEILLTVWLTEAETNTATITDTARQAEAQKAWCYYRAYSAVANRIGATPSSEQSHADVSRSWSDNRANYWRKQADSWLEKYNELSVETVTTVTPDTAWSGSVGVVSVW